MKSSSSTANAEDRAALVLARGIVTIAALWLLYALFVFAPHRGGVRDVIRLVTTGKISPDVLFFWAGVVLALVMLAIQRRARGAFILAMVVVLVVMTEGLAHLWNHYLATSEPVLVQTAKGSGMWRVSPDCGRAGYCPAPFAEGAIQATVGGKEVFRWRYSTDEFGRRNTLVENVPKRTHFLMFFGCSFTYGQAVNDNETLPYFAGLMAPSYMPYNFGVGGYGTNSILAQLQNPGFGQGVSQKTGVAVYIMLYEHIFRSIGDSVTLTWGADMPYYTLDNGSPVYQGPFWESRPLFSMMTRLVWASETAKLAKVRLPRRSLSRDDLILTTALVKETHRLFRNAFPGSRFVVVLYPLGPGMATLTESWVGTVTGELRDTGITVLDYTDFFALTDPANRVPVDRHPNGGGHRLLASRLVDDLKLLESPHLE